MVGPGGQFAAGVGMVDGLAAFRAGFVGHGQGKSGLHGGMFQHGVTIIGVVFLGEIFLQGFQTHGFCCNQEGIGRKGTEVEAFYQCFLGFGLGADFLHRRNGR